MVARVLTICFLVIAALGCGRDFSIPWAETTVVPPNDHGKFVYRQKGPHRAMVAVEHDGTVKECWLPWRPWLRHFNVYYYPGEATGNTIRLQDHLHEVVINIQQAKTYLLVRTPDEQVFMGEILSDKDGSHSASVDNDPWTAEVGERKAENFTGSVLSKNRGQYFGRIEVTESKGSALDPVVLKFVSIENSPEKPITRDE